VPGHTDDAITFDDSCIRFNNRLLKDCNTAEQYQVAIAIGLCGERELPFFCCLHGGDLDLASFAKVEQMLKDRGAQALIEFPTRFEEDKNYVQILLEDGHRV